MIWTTNYDTKFWLLGKLMDKMMVQRKFRSNIQDGLAAIDEHAQTGVKIGKDWVPTSDSSPHIVSQEMTTT